MKNRNIFPMLLVTLTAVSCQIYSGDSPSANSASLSSLSENLFENYFSTPSKYVLCMREVSRYIYDMTSDEQDASIFKYVVGQIQENTYHIENFGTVSTGGKPVDEAGAVWRHGTGMMIMADYIRLKACRWRLPAFRLWNGPWMCHPPGILLPGHLQARLRNRNCLSVSGPLIPEIASLNFPAPV